MRFVFLIPGCRIFRRVLAGCSHAVAGKRRASPSSAIDLAAGDATEIEADAAPGIIRWNLLVDKALTLRGIDRRPSMAACMAT